MINWDEARSKWRSKINSIFHTFVGTKQFYDSFGTNAKFTSIKKHQLENGNQIPNEEIYSISNEEICWIFYEENCSITWKKSW